MADGTAGVGDSRTRFGFVAIVGRANVGKSTFLNAVVGQKVSITSRKPQTTRHRIVGVRTDGEGQIAFVDTPGIQLGPRRGLNRAMNTQARAALRGVDVVLFMVEALKWTEEDAYVGQLLADVAAPRILVVTKVDRVRDKRQLLPFLQQTAAVLPFDETVPISVHDARSLDALLRCIQARLPPGPFMYPVDAVTDRSVRQLAGEIVREKLMRRLSDELPYALGVVVDDWQEKPRSVRIAATIWVEKESQRGIVIGSGGAVLREVGTRARQELEGMLGKRVHLTTWVKTRAGWADDPAALSELGLDD
ncbi:MAG: GTPase Era [Gammaproteobacteria bacterium]